MKPVCQPGTTAVAAGTAVFEAPTSPSGGSPGAGPDTPSVASYVPRPQPATEAAAAPAESAPPAGLAVLSVGRLDPDLPCTGDPQLFFAESPDDTETAKALCRECPARAACLAGALERREPWGVWGGELFLHGAIVPRKRPRGRPRKTDAAVQR